MSTRITILGAGFGGMELSTILSESLGDKVQVTLIVGRGGLDFDVEPFALAVDDRSS